MGTKLCIALQDATSPCFSDLFGRDTTERHREDGRVAFAELSDLDDAQGDPLPRRAHMTFGGKWSAAVLDRLPCLVERVHQYPHFAVVERAFCQKPPRTRYLQTCSWLEDNDNFVTAYGNPQRRESCGTCFNVNPSGNVPVTLAKRRNWTPAKSFF